MRTDLGPHHSQLHPPAVVGEGIVFPPIQGYLFPISDVQTHIRKHTVSRLRPPTVVTQAQPFIQLPLSINLTPKDAVWRRNNQRMVQWNLRKPTVIDLSPQTKYLSVNLTYSRRGVPKSVLRKPADTVGLEDQGRVKVELAPSARQARAPHSRLMPPVVIDLRPQTRYLSVHLAYSRRGAPKSRLEPPTAVATGQTFYGPFVHLVAVRTRVEQPQHRTIAGVRGPVFVGAGIAFSGPETKLAASPKQAREAHSALRPPAVAAAAQIYYGPSVRLAKRIPRRSVRSTYVYPIVVFREEALGWTAINLVRIRPPAVHSVLRPPATVTEEEREAGIIHGLLTRTSRRFFRVRSTLQPPTVVFRAVEIYGPTVKLAYSVRKRGVSDLKAPTVIDLRPQVYYLSVTRAPSRRGVPKSDLRAPAVVSTDRFFGPAVHLAPSRRPKARYGLAAPAVVFIAEPVLYPVSVTLAYSLRGKAKPFLRRPSVVGAVVYFGPAVTLTYSRRGAPRSDLRAPVVIDVRPQTYYLTVSLAYSRRGRALSFLQPPTVVDRRVYSGPAVHLAYSRRGEPVYELRPPTVIDVRPQTVFLSVTLAPSRRGRPMHFLRPAVLAQAKQFEAVSVHLAYSVRKRGRAVLRRPVVVFPFLARPTVVSLAPQSRGVAKSQLLPPAVIRERENRPLTIVFVRTRPRPTTRFLRPPTVVRVPENRRTRVTLTRILPRPTVALLKPPTVVFYPPVETTVRAWLTYSTRGVAQYGLAAPAVIAPAPLAEPIRVTLVQIRPPARFWRLFPPAVVNTFVPPGGEVCDFTSTDTEICDDTTTTDEVCDTTEAGSLVVGSDTTESRITGADTAVDEVCDSNEKAT